MNKTLKSWIVRRILVQGFERRSCCPFKLELECWGERCSAGTKLLNAGMDNELCFYLLLACCPVGIVLSCGWSPVICTNFHHQGISFSIRSVFCMVSVTCLDSVCLLLVLVLSWGVCARGSLWLPSALVPCGSCYLFQWNLMAAFSMVAFVSHLFLSWQGLDEVCSLYLGVHIHTLEFFLSGFLVP